VAEYMTDDDRVAAIRKWWEENGTATVVALVLVVGGVVGWRWYADYDRGGREQAAAAYEQYLAQRDAATPDVEAMARALEALDRDHRGSGYQTFSLFYRAADAIAREDFAEGEVLLATAVKTAKDGHLASLARIRLARLQHQMGSDADALGTLKDVKGAGFRAAAAELQGDILLSQGKRAEALAAYRAAAAALSDGGGRPLLEMKIADLTTAGTDAAIDAPAS
jgi:predicted negative regulator of RcsB-dependent stress response